MIVEKTPFKDLLIIRNPIHGDARGFFMEIFNEQKCREQGLNVSFKQDNLSRSTQGILRGLHYQLNPYAQGKLVTVLEGEVFDVAVDLRRKEPTFGQWFGYRLNATTREALYVPAGFAHGFCVLSPTADFFYKCTEVYNPAYERSVRWDDPTLNIAWPIRPSSDKISLKDKQAPLFEAVETF